MSRSIGNVQDSSVLGVRIEQHVLDPEVQRLVRLAKHLSRKAIELCQRGGISDEAEAKGWSAIAKMADSADRIVRGLLAEQRERAKMASGRPELTDERFIENMRIILRGMTDEEIERLRAVEQ